MTTVNYTWFLIPTYQTSWGQHGPRLTVRSAWNEARATVSMDRSSGWAQYGPRLRLGANMDQGSGRTDAHSGVSMDRGSGWGQHGPKLRPGSAWTKAQVGFSMDHIRVLRSANMDHDRILRSVKMDHHCVLRLTPR